MWRIACCELEWRWQRSSVSSRRQCSIFPARVRKGRCCRACCRSLNSQLLDSFFVERHLTVDNGADVGEVEHEELLDGFDPQDWDE